MVKVLLYLWQLPQNLLGLLIFSLGKLRENHYVNNYSFKDCVILYTDKFFRSGVSLGKYIILDYCYLGRMDRKTVNHEHGHSIQSKYLGWFYLLLIGIPSFIGNLISRFCHKSWTSEKKEKWYYNQLWEKQQTNLVV